MRALHGSGGSTKGAGILGAYTTAKEDFNYYPDIISGISVSALLAVPFALGKDAELRSIFENLTLEDIFNKVPVTSRGKLRFMAIVRALFGKSLGEMNGVIEILSDLVTEAEFDAYKKSPSYPDAVIMSVDYISGSRVFVNVKSLSYEMFLKHTLASASIPAYTPPVKIGKQLLFDGGTRDHIISHYVNSKYDVKESLSVYSRPKDLSALHNWEMKNQSIAVALRGIDILNYEVSKNDEYKEDKVAEERNIKNRRIYLPAILTSLYDTYNVRLKQLYKAGQAAATEEFSK